jgi:hypothetical protein
LSGVSQVRGADVFWTNRRLYGGRRMREMPVDPASS